MVNIEALKQAKKEKKITYEQLSEISGVPISTIYDLFRGVTTAPRIDTMQAIERALGLDSRTTLSDGDKALGAQEVPMFPLTEEEQDLIELRSEIIRLKGEEFWKTLETMLQAIAKEKTDHN